MRLSKRLISILLTAALLCSAVAVLSPSAFAVSDRLGDLSVGSLIEFGSYPQKRVTESSKLNTLNSKTLSWKYYDYYFDGKPENYMEYADVSDVFEIGDRYRAVRFSHYRPYYTTSSSYSDTYQDDNGYSPDIVYWFKFEPIVWRVLDPAKGLVMTESIIDSQPFENDLIYYSDNYYGDADLKHYASDWKYSSLRDWLNDDFYNTAFIVKEKGYIRETALQTPSSYLSKYDAGDSTDRVFLLTRSDVLNESYGFSSSFDSGEDTNRVAFGTDYAKCQGLYIYSFTGNYYSSSYWRLRTPRHTNVTNIVYGHGNIDTNYYTHYTCSGVRTALYLNPQSSIKIHDEQTSVTGQVKCPGYSFNCKYSYSDSYFEDSSDKYNNDLAICSWAFECASWNRDGVYDETPELAEGFFENLGFFGDSGGFKCYGYSETTPEFDGIACLVGYKNSIINGKDATVIACAVRGGGYEEEWGGNFRVGYGTEHEGFNIGADKVLKNINSFVTEKKSDIRSNVYFWLTGYSRGAAVANLVASKLNTGASAYQELKAFKPTKSKVFCYCFETPKNTTDSGAGGSAYNNIFNIIDPTDPVPKVPPVFGDFKFARYGVSYYMPSRETVSGYGKILDEYKTIFKEVNNGKYEYSDLFTFLRPSDIVLDTLPAAISTAVKLLRKNGQVTFMNNLIKYITYGALQNRDNYNKNYQESLIVLIAMFAGGYKKCDKDALVEAMAGHLKDFITKNIDSNILIPPFAITATMAITAKLLNYIDLENDLASDIADHSDLSLTESRKIISQLTPLLLVLIGHPDYALTLIASIFTKQSDGMPVMIFPHTNKSVTTWLKYMEGLSEAEFEKIIRKTSRQTQMKINCPVDLAVYDEADNLVVSIVDEDILDCGDNSLCCYIDEDGQKIIMLPEDGDYRVEITAREDCDVTVSCVTVDCDSAETLNAENYYDIGVKADKTVEISAKALTEENDPIRDINVIDNGETLSPDEVLDEPEEIACTVTVLPDDSSVGGGGIYDKGEFAVVYAFETEDRKFDGWYKNNRLISSDAEYRFCVKSDITLTAHFEEIGCKHDNTAIMNDVAPTCTEDGYSGDTVCTICNVIIKVGDVIPASGHSWNDGIITKAATCSEEGVITYTCTACNETKTGPVPKDAANHAEYGTEIKNKKEATEIEDGYTGDKVCSACGAVVEAGTVIPKLDHVYAPGDVNGDGDVLANDARLALRASAQLETLDEKQFAAADVNEDKKVLADDARQILRFSAQLVSEFKKAEN